MAALNKIYIYRMTHIENIAHVLQNGITHIASSNSNKAYVPIGDGSLIQTRQNFTTPFGTKLGEYIPFYFGCRMPMLYVVQNGFNGVTATNPENIVYCISSVQKVIDLNLDCVFTNGHAVNALSSFYDISQAPQIETLLDFAAIRAIWWNEDLDIKRRKEAEFLIKNDVPSEAIIGYVVYNESAQKRLIDLGIAAEKIVIKPNCYF
jgi:ssDNA thymidine ADP-ribosyltransferase, DarT